MKKYFILVSALLILAFSLGITLGVEIDEDIIKNSKESMGEIVEEVKVKAAETMGEIKGQIEETAADLQEKYF
jgi:hypothetical protein